MRNRCSRKMESVVRITALPRSVLSMTPCAPVEGGSGGQSATQRITAASESGSIVMCGGAPVYELPTGRLGGHRPIIFG